MILLEMRMKATYLMNFSAGVVLRLVRAFRAKDDAVVGSEPSSDRA